MFKNQADRVIYVGKAKNLKSRVRSYFQPPVKLGPKTAVLVSLVQHTDYIEVTSEIEALLLESKLIKKFKPDFNISAKDDKSPYFIHITSEKYPKPIVNHLPKGAVAGPFLSGRVARSILHRLRKVAPYCTALRKIGRPCFYSHLGLCRPCPNDPNTAVGEYRKNIQRLRKLLKGEFFRVKLAMEKQMRLEAKNKNFETAANIRDELKHLSWILTRPISPDEYLANPNLVADRQKEALQMLESELNLARLGRIEMYDVANLSGASATAAMTVAVNGEIISRNFRHFTLHPNLPAGKQDDVAMMKEVITRRLKRSDWPKPDLIVLDGGKSQLSAANGISLCPVIALAKKEEVITFRKNQGFAQIRLNRRNPGLQLLMRLRDEAHRFSRRLHHKHRRLA